ncbi:unnamed protein product [Aphanomyces euteiches]|uniref:FYVE-type domain-containing protein n=1 Tax=Aphanomyces euteiches TaxID=100861 RepID=A0A6G0XVY8_9STRA|nr:hypothetical protein Ae201684_001118 [Aphanomyces euteiches]KAH9099659.1 hypothetical protein Ae201684P_018672 [Aphanomyces euteiches]KAH9144917.1 hypothetical protein AeRB84_011136 [Aphanomyces euteiches]
MKPAGASSADGHSAQGAAMKQPKASTVTASTSTGGKDLIIVPPTQVILTQKELVSPDLWVDKQSRGKCYVCSRPFHTLLRTKHNCRKCGEVVCSKCRVAQILHMPSVPAKEYASIQICLVCNHSILGESSTDEKLHPRNASLASALSNESGTDAAETETSDGMIPCPYELDWNWVHPWPKPPALPAAVEAQQMEVLASLNILDTPREDAFDRIALAARKFTTSSCKVACVSFMDLQKQRQWFKGSCGLAQEEMPRIVSFCTHTIYLNQPVIVLDARIDERFCLNPLVTGSGQFRFYASVPITVDGVCIGTIFVLDAETRAESDVDISRLVKLSVVVSKLLVERREAKLHPSQQSTTSSRKPQQPPSAAEDKPMRSYSMAMELPPALSRHQSTDEILPSKADFPPQPPTQAPPKEPMAEPQPQPLPDKSTTVALQDPQAKVDASGNKMEAMLMNLLSQTTLTQQQIANQQGAMHAQIGQHSTQLNKLAEAVARMEAKLSEKKTSPDA